MATINAIWKIRIDEQTKVPTVRVEYTSDELPGEHERIHAALAAKAVEILREVYGPDAELKLARFEFDCKRVREHVDPQRTGPIPEERTNTN